MGARLTGPAPAATIGAMDLRGIDELPGPRPLPGIGNALRLRPDTLHLTLEHWSRMHGSVFRFAIGPRRTVICVTDRAAVNAALRDRPGGFRRSRLMQEMLLELGIDGVFTAEGDDWRRQRRLAVTALNTDHLRRFYAVVDAALGRLHGRLAAAADHGAPLDIGRELGRYTVDVTTALAFGVEAGPADAELERHVTAVFAGVGRRLSFPIPYWRRFKLPVDRELDRSVAVLREAIDGFIAAARARMDADPARAAAPANFLEGMLAAQRSEGRYSESELFGNVLTMLLAGEDTTAHTLAWSLWLLAQDPAARARLATEAAAVLGDATRPPDAASVERLDYAEGVVREALRLHGVAPVIFLETATDQVLGGVRVPAGTEVLLMTRRLATQDAAFTRPTTFAPERWLAGGALPAHDTKTFLPFGAGPRFCPGRNLALLEAKAALGMIGRCFEVTLDPAAPPVREVMGFTMAPGGLSVRLAHRPAAPSAAVSS